VVTQFRLLADIYSTTGGCIANLFPHTIWNLLKNILLYLRKFSLESIEPGPSSIDVAAALDTKYPCIVRAYTTTVIGGHPIDLPTTDYYTISRDRTEY